ncbi:Crp/Fnr family transcriptional regulator [Spirosoma flavum]|uniref:Crp/Fnr family transcriptional regulator n=1 Tax=Spirosoma flavum TaxID=2048557 RepID=A0ABW6ATN9_9BACT
MSHFSHLGDNEWDALVPHLSIVTLKKHQYLIQQGSVANQIGFVVDGLFRQFYTKDGNERTTYFFLEGQLVSAYMSCITNRPSPVTIEALSDVTCLCFSYSVLKSLFDQYPGWQLFGRRLAEYIMVALEERMAGLLLLSPEERYLDLVEGDQKNLLQRVPQHYIANYLGITPVSLSRIRHRVSRR